MGTAEDQLIDLFVLPPRFQAGQTLTPDRIGPDEKSILTSGTVLANGFDYALHYFRVISVSQNADGDLRHGNRRTGLIFRVHGSFPGRLNVWSQIGLAVGRNHA